MNSRPRVLRWQNLSIVATKNLSKFVSLKKEGVDQRIVLTNLGGFVLAGNHRTNSRAIEATFYNLDTKAEFTKPISLLAMKSALIGTIHINGNCEGIYDFEELFCDIGRDIQKIEYEERPALRFIDKNQRFILPCTVFFLKYYHLSSDFKKSLITFPWGNSKSLSSNTIIDLIQEKANRDKIGLTNSAGIPTIFSSKRYTKKDAYLIYAMLSDPSFYTRVKSINRTFKAFDFSAKKPLCTYFEPLQTPTQLHVKGEYLSSGEFLIHHIINTSVICTESFNLESVTNSNKPKNAKSNSKPKTSTRSQNSDFNELDGTKPFTNNATNNKSARTLTIIQRPLGLEPNVSRTRAIQKKVSLPSKTYTIKDKDGSFFSDNDGKGMGGEISKLSIGYSSPKDPFGKIKQDARVFAQANDYRLTYYSRNHNEILDSNGEWLNNSGIKCLVIILRKKQKHYVIIDKHIPHSGSGASSGIAYFHDSEMFDKDFIQNVFQHIIKYSGKTEQTIGKLGSHVVSFRHRSENCVKHAISKLNKL